MNVRFTKAKRTPEGVVIEKHRGEGSLLCVDQSLTRGIALFSMMLLLQIAMDVTNTPDTGAFLSGQLLHAQTTTEDPRPERNVPVMSASTYEHLSKFSKILLPEEEEGEDQGDGSAEGEDTRDLAEAQKILDRLLARSRGLNGNELAQVHRNYAWLAQEMGDTELAIYHLTQVLEYRASIRYAQEEMALNNLSRLHFSIEEYGEALDFATQYIELVLAPAPNDYVFMAQIYFQLEEFEDVKYWIRLAIDTQKELQRPIKEFWYQILLAAVNTLEQWDEALEVLKVLVTDFPSRDYWIGMAQAYAQLGQEDKATYTLEAAHTAGMLEKQTDFTNYASLIALEGAAIRATWILKEGFETEVIERSAKVLKWNGQYLGMARLYTEAIEGYEEAVELSEEGQGEIWYRIAQLNNQISRYAECVQASDMALRFGDLKKPFNVRYVKAVCEFLNEDFEASQETFTKLRTDLRTEEDEESLKSLVRAYLKSIGVEFEIIEHEKNVSEDERIYREEKARSQS